MSDRETLTAERAREQEVTAHNLTTFLLNGLDSEEAEKILKALDGKQLRAN